MNAANGQPLSPQDTRKPRGNYTGERLSVRKAQGIINALACGEPVERIARQLHTSKHTVMSVRERASAFGSLAEARAKIEKTLRQTSSPAMDRQFQPFA